MHSRTGAKPKLSTKPKEQDLASAVLAIMSQPNPPGIKNMLKALKLKNKLWGGLDSKTLRLARAAAEATIAAKQ
jgi:hypothetical protein